METYLIRRGKRWARRQLALGRVWHGRLAYAVLHREARLGRVGSAAAQRAPHRAVGAHQWALLKRARASRSAEEKAVVARDATAGRRVVVKVVMMMVVAGALLQWDVGVRWRTRVWEICAGCFDALLVKMTTARYYLGAKFVCHRLLKLQMSFN